MCCQILLQCLSPPQNLAAREMLLKKVFEKCIFELIEKRRHNKVALVTTSFNASSHYRAPGSGRIVNKESE